MLQEAVDVLKQDLEPQVRAFVSPIPSDPVATSQAEDVAHESAEVPAVVDSSMDLTPIAPQPPEDVPSLAVSGIPQSITPLDDTNLLSEFSNAVEVGPGGLEFSLHDPEAGPSGATRTELDLVEDQTDADSNHPADVPVDDQEHHSTALDAGSPIAETSSINSSQAPSTPFDAVHTQTVEHVHIQHGAETRRDEDTPYHAASDESDPAPTSPRDFTTVENASEMPISDSNERELS